MHTDSTTPIRRRRAWLVPIAALLAILTAPGAAYATDAAPATPVVAKPVTLVAPADGAHLDTLERAPMLQFDPGTDTAGLREQPKWILLATDAAMTKTVRYCRQFVWASDGGAFHWGCNRWATGADAAGNDQLLALEPGVYYWQVVSKPNSGTTDVTSVVRSFAIDPEKDDPSIADISEQVYGTAFDDGTQLNLGVAAYVNSGVRVKTINSTRLAATAFRISGTHIGAVDLTRSYVKISSAAGTRYLKVASTSSGTVGTVWRLSTAERRLRTKRFTYQLFLRSTKNDALVRSQVRVVLVRTMPRIVPD